MHYLHSHGTFFGELSVEKLMSLLSKGRKSNEGPKDRSANTGRHHGSLTCPEAEVPGALSCALTRL
jgi:hypothetical protein